MRDVFLLILFFAMMVGCAGAPWSDMDKKMFGVAAAASVFDCYTTSRALDGGNDMRGEWRFLYGGERSPSDGMLIGSKLVQMVILWLIADRLSSDMRKAFLGVAAGGWMSYGVQNEW